MTPKVRAKLAHVRCTQARRARLVAAGVCDRCGRVPVAGTGFRACPPCRLSARGKTRLRRAERRAARLCIHCESPDLSTVTMCRPCADRLGYWVICSRANRAEREGGVPCQPE